MVMTSISDFRSKVISTGLAKTQRAKVVINDNASATLSQLAGSNLNRLQFMCEQAEVPGKVLATTDIHYYGPIFKSPHEISMNQTSLTFFVSEAMDEKAFFDAWVSFISGQDNGYDMNFRSDYATTIDITTLKDVDTIDDAGSMTLTLNDAFPISVAPIQTSWGDDAFQQIMVDFVYTDYTITQNS